MATPAGLEPARENPKRFQSLGITGRARNFPMKDYYYMVGSPPMRSSFIFAKFCFPVVGPAAAMTCHVAFASTLILI